MQRDVAKMRTKPFKPHTILWADDDSDDLHIVKEVIDRIDPRHQMLEANNGKQALDYLHSVEFPEQLPCLVVLDINMPILNGKDALVLIKNNRRFDGVAVVVFTTSSNEKDRQFCRQFGVEMFSKPHTYSEFEEMVGKLLTYCKLDHTQAAFN